MKCMTGFITWPQQNSKHRNKTSKTSSKLMLLRNLVLYWQSFVFESLPFFSCSLSLKVFFFLLSQYEGDSQDVSLSSVLLVSHWTGSASRLIVAKYWFSFIIPCKHKHTHTLCQPRTPPPPQLSSVSERAGWTKTPTAKLFFFFSQDKEAVLFKDLKLL